MRLEHIMNGYTGMIERCIKFPLCDNDGKSTVEVIHSIESELLAIAGGFSETYESGQWVDSDTGVFYRNENIRIDTSISEVQDRQIERRLPVWCAMLHQVALYTHRSTVEVAFIEAVSVADMALVA